MRHIPLDDLLKDIYKTQEGKDYRNILFRSHLVIVGLPNDKRQSYVKNNGSKKWKGLKEKLESLLGRKCWYTEVEITGTALAIDHYRPVVHYWWLAFDSSNYRLSCSWANSPKKNPLYSRVGGKSTFFPLFPPDQRARGIRNIRGEKPILLDPCCKEDCNIITFQSDGRPVASPKYASNVVALTRLNESLIYLNIDHPDFNSKREELYHKVKENVETYEDTGASQKTKDAAYKRIQNSIAPKAKFSSAARTFLGFYRYLDWVEDLLNEN